MSNLDHSLVCQKSSLCFLLGCRCESCIDRLFTLGPAPCPLCNKTLRKLAFTPQTFEDLGVEKEVAVRRRMAKELREIFLCKTIVMILFLFLSRFNKRKEDFADLRSYNDYLEEVEDISMFLLSLSHLVIKTLTVFQLSISSMILISPRRKFG